jgi:hypothetical protein
MMGQDEDLDVIGRIVSPPTLPLGVRPIPANGTEHVPPKNPGPDIAKATRREIVVNPGGTAIPGEHGLLEPAGRDQPLVQFLAADAERMVEVLIGTRSVSVEREGETFNANPGGTVRRQAAQAPPPLRSRPEY